MGDHALEDDGREVGDGERGAGELLHEEDRQAPCRELADLVVQLRDHDRRQAHGQLVEQQQLRSGGERPGQGEHLLLTAGQRPGQLLAAHGELGELLEGHVLDAAHRHPDLCGHEEVLADAEVGEHSPTLGDGADSPAGSSVRGDRGDRVALEAHLAAARGERAGAHIEQRGLAAAIGPEERDHRSGRHLEAHAVHDLNRSVAGADVAELEDGRGRRGRAHGAPR